MDSDCVEGPDDEDIGRVSTKKTWGVAEKKTAQLSTCGVRWVGLGRGGLPQRALPGGCLKPRGRGGWGYHRKEDSGGPGWEGRARWGHRRPSHPSTPPLLRG